MMSSSRRSSWLPCSLLVGLVACAPPYVPPPGPDGSRDGGGPPVPDRPDADWPDDGELTWRRGNLTNFTSYPEPGSEECEDFSGCKYAGHFAFVEGQQSEAWVMSHNIAAVHADDADQYALKTLRVRDGGNTIDVTVYDMCSDDDCGGCCSQNASETGFLIDLESYTAARFGLEHGVVDWACLDCD